MDKKYRVTWKQYIKAIDDLYLQIKLSKKTYKGIFGIARGGLIPAAVLSYKLNIPLVESVTGNEALDILFVDDICDSGETLSWIIANGKIDSAVVYAKRSGPTFISKMISKDIWIKMPYDSPTDTVSIKTEDFYEELRKRNKDKTILKYKK